MFTYAGLITLTPEGHEIWHKGITPDVVVELPKEKETAPKERPLPSADPLDDLKKDVQVQRALEVIKAMKTAHQLGTQQATTKN